MNKCLECGEEVESYPLDDRYCSFCGALLSDQKNLDGK